MTVRHWLFVNAEKVAEWPSLESCQSHAAHFARKGLNWDQAEDGPQGAGPHWYAHADFFGQRQEYMIVKVDL